MPFPCRSPALLIHTCHATTLPFSDSAVSFVKVRVVAGNIRTASLLLVTTFVELRVVAGRSLTRAGRPHAVSGRPMLIHTYHAALCRGLERSLSEQHGRGMACVNQTRPHCVNQIGKTQSKPLAERHGMCELVLRHYSCNDCPTFNSLNPCIYPHCDYILSTTVTNDSDYASK
jgi:hypothetical protein